MDPKILQAAGFQKKRFIERNFFTNISYLYILVTKGERTLINVRKFKNKLGLSCAKLRSN